MLIDIYLPSLYRENLNKYEQKYHDVQKQKNECTDEAQRAVLKKELSSLYKKKFARGYFRDRYDGFDLLKSMGLSYEEHVFPFLDNNLNLSVQNVIRLEKIMVESKLDETYKPRANPLAAFMMGESMTPKKIHAAKLKFLTLLGAAIKRNEVIEFKITGGIDLTEEQKVQTLKDLGVPD